MSGETWEINDWDITTAGFILNNSGHVNPDFSGLYGAYSDDVQAHIPEFDAEKFDKPIAELEARIVQIQDMTDEEIEDEVSAMIESNYDAQVKRAAEEQAKVDRYTRVKAGVEKTDFPEELENYRIFLLNVLDKWYREELHFGIVLRPTRIDRPTVNEFRTRTISSARGDIFSIEFGRKLAMEQHSKIAPLATLMENLKKDTPSA